MTKQYPTHEEVMACMDACHTWAESYDSKVCCFRELSYIVPDEP